MTSNRLFCSVVVKTVLLLSRPAITLAAGASDDSSNAQEIGLHYDAPSECPGMQAYLAEVEQRLGSNWKAALGQLAERMVVTITRADERYRGVLEFENVSGEHFSRTVSGTVCSEVVDGLGLITELAAKARVDELAVRSKNEGLAGEASSSTPAHATRGRPTTSSDNVADGPTTATRVRTQPSSASDVHVRFGGRASLASGIGPEVVFGPGVFAVLELAKARLGVAVDSFDSGEVRANAVQADFRLSSARLEGCPWSFGFGTWATLEPCAAGELGSFRAAPHLKPPVVIVSEPKAITWGALGLLGRLVLRLPPFVGEVELVGRAPLRREAFFVGSRDRVVFRIPAVSAGVSVGLGLRF